MNWNKLLEKQVRNHLSPELLAREDVRKLLNAIDNSYSSYERDRTLSAHAFAISEQEYSEICQKLEAEMQLKKLGISNLREAISSIEGSRESPGPIGEEEDNFLFALSYLHESVRRQKQMERDLKDSESKLSASAKTFSQLIRNLNNGILLEDADRKVVLANQLFCDMLNIPLAPEMLVGMDCKDMADICKALFRDAEDFSDRVKGILDRKELITGEEIEMRSGKVLIRDFIPIHVDNEYKGSLWKFEDITHERETKSTLQRLSLVASTNENGVLFTDPEGTITWANEGLCRLTGYCQSEIIGKTPIALCKGPMSDRGNLRQMLELFHAGKSFSIEVIHYRKDRTCFWGRVKGQSILDEQGRIVQYFAMVEDVTINKELERDIIEAKEQAEQSSRAKENFLANMSHEIRTPMNAILGMSRQLKKTNLNEQQRFFLDTIHSAADHLLVIINDILDISKIEAGKLVLENIGFSLEELAGKIQRVMYHKAEEKGLLLSVVVDPAIPAVLVGDPYRLNQVLLNLISNSIKFTVKGRVELRCEVIEDGRIRCSVMDTGIGMDEGFRAHLFEKFEQEDAAVARKHGGTGLGMSITKHLVELMGGTIQVESRKGVGTRVYVEVPLPRGMLEELPVKEEKVTSAEILKGKRILLVEDNEMNRLVATTVLHHYGAVVTEAFNGAEAITCLQAGTFDLVLMDMQMPVMDGLEATRRIRQLISPTLPVIALTANAIKGESDKCLDAGMNDYLSKPFEEDELIGKIAHWLDCGMPTVAAACAPRTALPLYDLSKLREVSRGNEAFVEKVVRLFLLQVPSAVCEIRKAYEAADYKQVKDVTHRIRPVLDSLGVRCLTEDLKELERLALAGDGGTRMDEITDKLQETVGGIARSLNAEVGAGTL
ncbi:MAG: response regulator [Bacteroidetes bacterium]|nr:response regulator [Bacteroidota bacterium]